ncbi:unnamed protein product [Parnassius mnemosyne]|uniref:Reverse transcriptase domain-containing protein n=1 Tax=Parnassius mnemosyne TaxID=213953 RepID=A0AAV1M5Y6_9NEOP
MLLDAFEIHAPLKLIRLKRKPTPWITDNIKLMMTLRDSAHNRANTSGKDSHNDYYKSLRNLVNSAINREKSAYFTFFINKNQGNPKTMWSHLKRISPVGNQSGQICVPSHLCNPDTINNYFIEVPGDNKIDKSTINYFISNRLNNTEFNITTATESEVYKVITAIGTKASGHDLINIDMVRISLPVTLPIITGIINESINTKIFPDPWKLAKIKPIPKSPNVQEINNLRPISILPTLSKILERVVCSQLTRYLKDNHILPEIQSGFRRGYGTETALLHVTDDITTASDKGKGSILVLLDFTRAFDCINHDILLAKLSYYGVSEATCKWFYSFLSNRSQYVEINTDQGEVMQSSLRRTSRGTPQGSILSPILFILFTADISKVLKHSKIHLYADDTQIYHSFKPEQTENAVMKLNEDLSAILQWAKKKWSNT